jgi:trans-2,3-dihydro-3-hydroxyanthranilate isomerase
MTEGQKFFITDVFAQGRYSGNQLGTFLDAADVPPAEMQQIARELNFAETTFVTAHDAPRAEATVRIFTPEAELEFAGHPTLGTAWIVRRHVFSRRPERVVLRLKVGPVPVTFVGEGADEVVWMRQMAPKVGRTWTREEMAPVLGLGPDDIDTRAPIEEVSTGLPSVIVPLRSMDALRRVAVERSRYLALLGQAWAKLLLACAPDGYAPGQALGVRVFPIAYGIAEDPATGSANGCLGAWLSRHRYLGGTRVDVAIGQGYEIGRPSTLLVRASEADGGIQVEVGGQVVQVAEGWWTTAAAALRPLGSR